MTVDRIDLIVALSIKNMQHPNRNSFPAFVRKILASKCQVSPAVATAEIKTVLSAWHGDRWAGIIRNNPYNITEEEVNLWEESYKRVSCTL